MKVSHLVTAAAVTSLALSGQALAQSSTLQQVMDRGTLNCGTNTGLAGFSFTDAQGQYQGFDIAICRAIAAAIFDDPSKVEFTPLTGKTRFTALASGEVDVLARNTTWTLSRDADLKFTFAPVNYYDGQGFMVPKDIGVSSALDLDGATICIQTGTTTELNLADYFRANDMDYEPVPIETDNEAQQKYLADACDAYTTDASGLASVRASFENPDEHVILPEIISKEPLAPLVRHGDDEWSDIVSWVVRALILAEEKDVTQANVEEMAQQTDLNPDVARLLGVEGEYGAMLGLDNDWAVRAIAAVGNYGEIFDRYLGPDTQIGLERGLNALYTEGGILYAPPIR
ncbi:amino acid ABC transporter substrate-binding protein [Acuticoccus sp.]|uniref:amino acid ABC transporter substrate-binding protein n=1 Tax=Acuticoccus sp. TaxID=1904378 RepID=UPI003B52612B